MYTCVRFEQEEEARLENLRQNVSGGDFSSINGASDLEALGLDFIKEELNKRGMKCGGRLQERAQRLFLLKNYKLEDIDRKHFAKQSSKV